MNSSNALRKIRLMTDYECFPLWEDGDTKIGNIDPASLPITRDLQKALTGWALRYDAILNREDPANSGFASEEEERQFRVDGVTLLQRLRQELGSTYSVRLQM